MKYTLLAFNKIKKPIYYAAKSTSIDKKSGVNLIFYSFSKRNLLKLKRFLYNIEEGKFYRRQPNFRIMLVKKEKILQLQQYGLNGEGKLYKISLKISNIDNFNSCYVIIKRIVRRIRGKFIFKPIIRKKKRAIKKIQKYFLGHFF